MIIDVTGWTQEQKNYLQAAAVALLWQAGISSEDISVKDNIIDVPNTDVSSILTASKVKAFIVAELEKIRIDTEEALLEARVREAELVANEFRDIKLADVDARIDTIQTLDQVKTVLKKFTRFVIARM